MAKLKGDWIGDVYVQDSGTGNGSTTTFALSSTPHSASSVIVSLNGLRQKQGGSDDYTVNTGAATITFNTAPATAQEILVSYMKKD